MATVLMGQALKEAIQRLSQNRLAVDTKTVVKYGKYMDKKTKNYTINDMKMVIGAEGKRKTALTRCGLPGSKVCMWQMDSPITHYWQGRVDRLAKELGVSKSKTFDIYDN